MNDESYIKPFLKWAGGNAGFFLKSARDCRKT